MVWRTIPAAENLSRVHPARFRRSGKEASRQPFSGIHIASGGGLGIDGQRQPGVTVTQTGRSCLEVDATPDHLRSVSPSQVVEPKTSKVGDRTGRQPDPATPMRVVQRLPGWAGKNQRGRTDSEPLSHQMKAHHDHQRCRHGEDPATGPRLWWSRRYLTATHLLDHSDGAAVVIDCLNTQTSDLAPAKAQDGAQVRHRCILDGHRCSQGLQFGRADYPGVPWFNGRQLNTPTR